MHLTICEWCSKKTDHLVNNCSKFLCCKCESIRKQIPSVVIKREYGLKHKVKKLTTYSFIMETSVHGESSKKTPCMCNYKIPEPLITVESSDGITPYNAVLNGTMTISAIKNKSVIKLSCINSGPWTVSTAE